MTSQQRTAVRVPIAIARIAGSVGIVCYNWWLGVAVSGRLLVSPSELFSDLQAVGRPYAAVLSDLDVAAGALMLVALVLRGRDGPNGVRPEWWLLLTFAVAGIVGGLFPYLCPEGLSVACRTAEWHGRLAGRHYVHVAAGIVEFASASLATLQAWRRTAGRAGTLRSIVRVVGATLIIGYPFLAAAYLTGWLGAFVEPVFFVSFSAMVAVELFEPKAD